MCYAIISDVHSNLEAFQEVIGYCQARGIKDFLCAGDLVGYGASPGECLKLVDDLNIRCVAGNHDWAASGRLDFEYFSLPAQRAVVWTQAQLSPAQKHSLNNLEPVSKREDCILVHGTLDHPQEFNYLMDTAQASDTFFLMDRTVCFVGHTHVPQILIKHKDFISYARSFELTLNPELKYIINVGSVGQPRDGNPKASFGIYDTQAQTISIKRIAYDIESAQKKILTAGLPEILARRLSMGE